MNAVADALVTITESYFGSIRLAGNECRLHIPGITSELANAIHAGLIAKGLPSFLVIPEDNDATVPSKEDRRLYAEGLTSLREGAMLIVTLPGQGSFIQDSIIGSGGTIRGSAFSDEWPWVDDGNESFRFGSKVCPLLFDAWGIAPDDRPWFEALLIGGVRKALEAFSNRAEILFDDLLLTVTLGTHNGERNAREGMLRYLGIPRLAAYAPDDNYARFMARVLKVTRVVIEEAKEVGARSRILERAPQVAANHDIENSKLSKAAESLFDRIGSKPPLGGILALRACFEGDPVTWSLLSIEILEELFSIEEPQESKFDLELSVAEGSVSGNKKLVVTFHDMPVNFRLTYSGLQLGNNELVARYRNKDIYVAALTGESGTLEGTIPPRDKGGKFPYQFFHRYNGALPDKPFHKANVACCGPEKWFLVLQPSLAVLVPVSTSTADEPEVVALEDPATVQLFRDDQSIDLGLLVDGTPLDLRAISSTGRILEASEEIDPVRTASGSMLVHAESASEQVDVELRAELEGEGEFSVEDELRARLAQGKIAPLKKLLNLFETGEGAQPRLGGISAATLQRIAYAREFEGLTLDASKAIALSTKQFHHTGCKLETTAACRCSNDLLSHLDSPLGQEASAAIARYSAARKELREFLKLAFPTTGKEHPDYAAFPIYVKDSEDDIASLITAYLEAYTSLLDYLGSRPSWHEHVVLLGLDCVTMIDGNSRIPFILVGPWHPLVVARRFLLQKHLSEAARHFLSTRGYKYNRLAPLLQETPTFRWIPGATSTGTMPLYVVSTSDPGWMLAIPAVEGEAEISEIVSALRRTLALETALTPVDVGRAGKYFKDYLTAFPSKRALSVEAGPSYAFQQVFDSASKIMRDENGDITPIGRQLPGGIHLAFHGDHQEMDKVEWASPPICLYSYQDESELRAHWKQVDISLVSPCEKPRFARRLATYPVARGLGDMSAYFLPMAEMTIMGQRPITIVSSSLEEKRSPEGLPGAMNQSLEAIESRLGSHMALEQQHNLPRSPVGTWTILPGKQVDPAALVSYVSKVTSAANMPIGLWDYHVSLSRSSDSYYVLSTLPQGIAASLEGGPFFQGTGSAAQILRELGEVGIAVGREAMRSESKARGVIGLIGGIRLFKSKELANRKPVMPSSDEAASFLVPIDSFEELISGMGDADGESFRRADLVAIQIHAPRSIETVKFSIVAIECKYWSDGTFPTSLASEAISQARETAKRTRCLAEEALKRAPELIAFSQLVNFGLRITAGEGEPFKERDARIMRALMQRRFKIAQPVRDAVLVTSEGGLQASKIELDPTGYWVRLSPNEWPALDGQEPANLATIRDKLRELFAGMFEGEVVVGELIAPTTNVAVNSKGQSAEEESTVTVEPFVPPPAPKPAVHPAPTVVETPKPAVSKEPETLEAGDGLHFAVGNGLEAFEHDRQYFFNPSNTTLTHLNIGIVGNLGTGKTQLVKSLIHNLVASPAGNRGKPVKFLIFDYKGDYTGEDFTSRIGARVVAPHKLPINLFDTRKTKSPNPAFERARFFFDVLKKIYPGLGPIQDRNLKKSIQQCAARASAGGRYPLLHEIRDEYEAIVGGKIDSALSILSDMVDLQLFEIDPARVSSFDEFFNGVIVIDLRALGMDDAAKNMIVVIFLNLYFEYMLSIEKAPFIGKSPNQHRFVDSMLLVDEAEQIMRYEFPVLKSILLQGREFGIGVLLASQFLSHFAQSDMDYRETLLTWFIHQVPNITKNELQSIGLSDASVVERIRNLACHECLYKTSGVPGKFIRGTPFFEILRNLEGGNRIG